MLSGAARGCLRNVINDDLLLPHSGAGSRAVFVRVLGIVLTTLLAQSFFWSPANPFMLKIVVAGVALLASSRPDVALLVFAAFVPFGRLISLAVSPSGPTGTNEALVLAYLAGWLWSRLRGGVPGVPASSTLSLGYFYAAVVVASLLVEIGVYRYWRDYWHPFLGQLLTYLARDFLNAGLETRPWAAAFDLPAARTAAVFLEGVALTRAVQVSCTGNPAFGRRLLWTLAITAVGTAVLSAWDALQLAYSEGRTTLSILLVHRSAVHVTKINTASSYFVLSLSVLIGLAAWSPQFDRRSSSNSALRRVATAAGVGLLFTALWLAGGRAALMAGMIVAVGAMIHAVLGRRAAQRGGRSLVAIAIACSIMAAVMGVGLYLKAGSVVGGSTLDRSFGVRAVMWHSALGLLAAHPLFGAGIGQCQYQVGAFVPDEAARAYIGSSRFNAHNQFLEMAAELGVIGGVLFVGMFAAILWRAWKAFRTSRDPALGGAIAGVVAFLITCLAGQPLLYNVVAFPFWMVLGVLAAGGDMSAEAAHARPTPASRRLWSRVIAGFMIVLALSIPVRVWQGKEHVNFALVKYGFSGLHEPSDGRHYRLVRGDGTFFTYPHARWLRLPIRRDVEAGRNRLEVDVSLDGRRARTLVLADDEWQTVEFMIPANANRRFRRIDLTVRAPAGVAAQVRVAPAEITEDEAAEKGRSR